MTRGVDSNPPTPFSPLSCSSFRTFFTMLSLTVCLGIYYAMVWVPVAVWICGRMREIIKGEEKTTREGRTDSDKSDEGLVHRAERRATLGIHLRGVPNLFL